MPRASVPNIDWSRFDCRGGQGAYRDKWGETKPKATGADDERKVAVIEAAIARIKAQAASREEGRP